MFKSFDVIEEPERFYEKDYLKKIMMFVLLYVCRYKKCQIIRNSGKTELLSGVIAVLNVSGVL